MSAQIINGKEIALSMHINITHRVDDIKKKFNITPTLTVIMVGNDPASEIYVGNKEKSAHSVGMNSIQFEANINAPVTLTVSGTESPSGTGGLIVVSQRLRQTIRNYLFSRYVTLTLTRVRSL